MDCGIHEHINDDDDTSQDITVEERKFDELT